MCVKLCNGGLMQPISTVCQWYHGIRFYFNGWTREYPVKIPDIPFVTDNIYWTSLYWMHLTTSSRFLIYKSRTDNTMARKKRTQGQTMIYKTLSRNPTTETLAATIYQINHDRKHKLCYIWSTKRYILHLQVLIEWCYIKMESHCIVCPSNYGLWLPLGYLQTFLDHWSLELNCHFKFDAFIYRTCI
jgi:hypothetical protein